LWVVWGEPTALVAGNNLLAIGDIAANQLREADTGIATAVEAGHILTQRYLSMMEGQYLDIAYEGRTDVTVDEYLAMIERKTGALIEGAVELGALVGSGGSREILDGFSRYVTMSLASGADRHLENRSAQTSHARKTLSRWSTSLSTPVTQNNKSCNGYMPKTR
jgi:hypothetical protein